MTCDAVALVHSDYINNRSAYFYKKPSSWPSYDSSSVLDIFSSELSTLEFQNGSLTLTAHLTPCTL